jgi:hypothetical protein
MSKSSRTGASSGPRGWLTRVLGVEGEVVLEEVLLMLKGQAREGSGLVADHEDDGRVLLEVVDGGSLIVRSVDS